MVDKDENKNLFEKIGDAFSSRDEKEALEKAQKELAEAKKIAADAIAAKKNAEEEQKRVAVLEANLRRVQEAEKRKAATEARRAQFEARKKEMAEKKKTEIIAEKTEIIAEHTVKADETLSHIALKYYKHATEPYWRHIYEANKDVIGDNPNIIRPGMVLKITVLPKELKK